MNSYRRISFQLTYQDLGRMTQEDKVGDLKFTKKSDRVCVSISDLFKVHCIKGSERCRVPTERRTKEKLPVYFILPSAHLQSKVDWSV